MVRKTKVAVVEHPRGGEGSVEFHHIVSAEELNGHGSMYAMQSFDRTAVWAGISMWEIPNLTLS